MSGLLENYKTTYPRYKNIPDSVLIGAYKKKYPKYANVPDSILVQALEKKYAPEPGMIEKTKQGIEKTQKFVGGLANKWLEYRGQAHEARKVESWQDVLGNALADIYELPQVPVDIIASKIQKVEAQSGAVKRAVTGMVEMGQIPLEFGQFMLQSWSDLLVGLEIPGTGLGVLPYSKEMRKEAQERIAKHPLFTLLGAGGATKLTQRAVTPKQVKEKPIPPGEKIPVREEVKPVIEIKPPKKEKAPETLTAADLEKGRGVDLSAKPKAIGEQKVIEKTKAKIAEVEGGEKIKAIEKSMQKTADAAIKRMNAQKAARKPPTGTFQQWIQSKGGASKQTLRDVGISHREERGLYMRLAREKGRGLDDLRKTFNEEMGTKLSESQFVDLIRRNTKIDEHLYPETIRPKDQMLPEEVKESDILTEGKPSKVEIKGKGETVNIKKLDVGDEFTINKEKYKVVEVDYDAGVRGVELVDGKRYRLDEVFEPDIKIDKGSFKDFKEKMKPKTPEQEYVDQLGKKGIKAKTGLTKDQQREKMREKVEAGELKDDMFVEEGKKTQVGLFPAKPSGIIYKPQPILPERVVKAYDAMLERSEMKGDTKAIIRRNLGELDNLMARAWEAGRKRIAFWDKASRNKEFVKDYITLYEKGNIKTIENKYGKEYAQLAKEYKKRLDESFNLTKEELQEYIEDYWPHIWDNPKKAQKFFSNYSKKMGKPGFMKQRVIRLFEEGLDYGLKPKSWNPEEIVHIREVAAWQYLTTKKIRQELKDDNLLHFFRNEKQMHEYDPNYRKLNHRAFETYYKNDKGELVKAGFYAAPESAAKIVNNWLSPSLWSRQDALGVFFRGAMRVKNPVVSVKLGLSGFHAIEITMSDIANQMALAAQLIPAKGVPLKTKAKALAQVGPQSIFIDLWRGSKIKEAYYKGAKPGTLESDAVQLMKRANFKPMMTKKQLHDVRSTMVRNWNKGEYFRATAKIPLAIIETTMVPLMEKYVPALKTASFFKMAQIRLVKELAAGRSLTRLEIDRILADTANLMDNRFGQMIYDNIFWKRTYRDLLIGSSLSLGWNLGTLREFGGAYLDVGKAVTNIAAGKPGNLISQRVLYHITYPLVVGTVGAILYKMFNDENPQELKDYFYPKTGAKNSDGSDERLQIPTMMKEFFATHEAFRKRGAIKGPLTIAHHKLAPSWGMVAQMMENENYWGVKITDAPVATQQWLKDYGSFMLEFAEPISFSSYGRQQSEKGRNILPFLGFSPAPRYVTRTATQKKIYDAFESLFGNVTKTKALGERIIAKSDLRQKIRKGEATLGDFREALKSGALKPRGIKRFLENATLDGDIRMFANLPSDIQSDLMDEMSMDEIKRYVWFAHEEAKINLIKFMQSNK